MFNNFALLINKIHFNISCLILIFLEIDKEVWVDFYIIINWDRILSSWSNLDITHLKIAQILKVFTLQISVYSVNWHVSSSFFLILNKQILLILPLFYTWKTNLLFISIISWNKINPRFYFCYIMFAY